MCEPPNQWATNAAGHRGPARARVKPTAWKPRPARALAPRARCDSDSLDGTSAAVSTAQVPAEPLSPRSQAFTSSFTFSPLMIARLSAGHQGLDEAPSPFLVG